MAPTGRDGLAELKREGYVFQLWYCPPNTWGPEKEAQLDNLVKLSEQQGTKLVISIHDLQGIKPGDQAKIAELRRVITKYRNSPAVLFWKGQDEPQWSHFAPEDLRVYFQTVHELDPNHPIWITQAPRGTVEQLRPYSSSSTSVQSISILWLTPLDNILELRTKASAQSETTPKSSRMRRIIESRS